MRAFWDWIQRYPAQISGTVLASFNLGLVLGLYHYTPLQVEAVNGFVAYLFAQWTHNLVTPLKAKAK